MSVESSANNISQLNANWPLAEDFVSEGDDHIRLLKKTVKQTFPNIKNSVDINNSQLNKLAKAMPVDDKTESITLNTLTVEKGGYGYVGKTDFRVPELKDNTIVNVKMLREIVFPVGSVTILNSNEHPKTLYGFGTWTEFGQGRVLIGVGTHTDARGEARSYTRGNGGGEFQHVLSAGAVPAHNHTFSGSGTTTTNGNHNHSGNVGTGGASFEHHQWNGRMPCESWRNTTGDAGNHNHTVTISGTTSSAGSNGAHNNMQPFLAVAMWVRTA